MPIARFRLPRRLVLTSLGLAALALQAGLLRPHIVRCLLLSARGNAALGEGVHTDAPGDPVLEARQRLMLGEARRRLETHLGPLQGRSRILLCQHAETLWRYSRARHGVARTVCMPGLSVMVLGPEGQSSLYLAHEWTHGELQVRLGYRRILWQVPGWFQEGLCMVVRGDTRFPEAAWREMEQSLGFRLQDMDSLATFQRHAGCNSLVAYGMAQALSSGC